jgi:DNA-directed RNA polymerase subunit RPC12/RpoP
MNIKICERDDEHWFIDQKSYNYCPYCGGKLYIQISKKMLENG